MQEAVSRAYSTLGKETGSDRALLPQMLQGGIGMVKLRSLKDLHKKKESHIIKTIGKDDEVIIDEFVRIDDLKQMAIPYVKLKDATPKDNKISLYFHCKSCLTNGKPSQVDVGWAGSQSRIVVECKNCRKVVAVFDLAEAQSDVVAHMMNLTDQDLKEEKDDAD